MTRRSLLRNTLATATLGITILCVLPVYGYRMIQNFTVGRVTSGALVPCNHSGGFAHWVDPDIGFGLNPGLQGAGKATAISNALTTWTNVANANHNLTYTGTTIRGWATDGYNTVLWAYGNGCTGNCLALTALVLQSGQVIVESDVTFNNNYSWQTNGSTHDTQAVATHEFGHSLGIHHTELTSTPRPTMYGSYFGSGGRTLESDDRSALQCAQNRYPLSGGGTTEAPATPAWMFVEREICGSLASLWWGTSAGATYYEAQSSWQPNFFSANTIYSGPFTTVLGLYINPVGTTYFRVRACNGGGCSGYRFGGSATYSSCNGF